MSDGTPKMMRVQAIQFFLQERGENWDLANYQIKNPDKNDGKMTLVRVTPDCICKMGGSGGVVIDPKKGKVSATERFELIETITIKATKIKKEGEDEFVMTYETPICSYRRVAYQNKKYVQEYGEAFQVEKIMPPLEQVGEPKKETCTARKTMSEPTSKNQISYGAIMAANGENDLPAEFTTIHKPLIDSLKEFFEHRSW